MAGEVDVAYEVAVAGRTSVSLAGAAPVWDITTRTLLWVERGGETVHRFDPVTGHDEPLKLPQPVAAAHPRRSGGLVLTLRDGVALLDPDGTRRWLVYWAREGVTGAATTVDQSGRLWVATAGDGALLRVEPDGELCVAAQGLNVGGIAFAPDGSMMYLADVAAGQITAADFDPDSGEVGSRRLLCPVPGGADALCVNVEGRLWVASGTTLHRYRPDSTLDRQLPMCAPPTGCAFGGAALADLYVTTAPPYWDTKLSGPVLVLANAGKGVPTPVFPG